MRDGSLNAFAATAPPPSMPLSIPELLYSSVVLSCTTSHIPLTWRTKKSSKEKDGQRRRTDAYATSPALLEPQKVVSLQLS